MRSGRGVATAAVGGLGLVVACVGLPAIVLLVCAGLWLLIWPVNYLGCGTERPADITTMDLAGVYVADDGARLDLGVDGTFTASGLDNSDVAETSPPWSGSGTWSLQPEDMSKDIRMYESEGGGGHAPDLYISGRRDDPWLYWYVGDPDTCNLYRLDRV